MINAQQETAQYIKRIMEERCVLIASSADYHASIMTAIVDILEDEGEVVFDYSGTKELDRLIGKSAAMDFTTYIDGINVTFASGAVEDTVHKDRPAFKIKMPGVIHKVQRRDYFRASPALSERPECVMEYDGNAYQAIVVDISIGGIGALIRDADFRTGDVIEKCRIVTPIGIVIEATVEIVNVRNKRDENTETRYGCTFKDISAAVESNLQRYVFHLERQEIAKRRELQGR